MSFFLVIIGALIVIGGLVLGIMSGHPLGVILGIAGGAASAAIYFALAAILENQLQIMRLINSSPPRPRLKAADMKICTKCADEYEADMSSCPNCGFRPS